MPAVVKILVVFVSMLLLTRLRLHLGAALVLGGMALDLWAGVTPVGTMTHIGRAFVRAELWLFLAITVLIIEIGRYMTKPGNAGEIIGAARRWGGRHGRAASLMVLPAVVGLVPMPAGALFSAPFVQQGASDVVERPEWKAAVNYWFRHIWEYWWPLYPGVIVAMSVFGMDAWRFVLAQAPYTPVAAGAGYVFLVRPFMRKLSGGPSPDKGSNRRAALILLPLLVVNVSLFVTPFALAHAFPGLNPQTRKLLAVLLGLVGGLLVIARDERVRAARRPRHTGAAAGREAGMFSTVLHKQSLDILATLAGVLVFKCLLEASDLLPLAGRELVGSGIPPAVAVAGLPFLAGLVTGIAMGFTGVSFPLVVGLMGAEASGLTPFATLVLAYGFGYMGMMLSPVHLCLLVTKDYFTASMPAIYRAILPCVLTILAYCLAAHTLLAVLRL